MGSGDIKRELQHYIGFKRRLYERSYPVFRNGFIVDDLLKKIYTSG